MTNFTPPLNNTFVQDNLAREGITLPTPATSVANYVGYTVMGNAVVISGQLPMKDGAIVYEGHVGDTVSIEDGYAAARLCAVNILTQLYQAVDGDWSRIVKCVRLGGFVASPAHFKDHPRIINGASDLMVAILGDAGRHARAAVGVSSLPLGAAVEVEAMFEILPSQ